MRTALASALLLAALAAPAAAAPAAGGPLPAAHHPLLHWRVRAWQPPAAPLAGLRAEFDPVSGEWVVPTVAAGPERRVHPLADIRAQVRADGSRFATLGSRGRVYSLAVLGDDGALRHECAHDEAEALARVRAAEARGER
jgi:hypothetical protein